MDKDKFIKFKRIKINKISSSESVSEKKTPRRKVHKIKPEKLRKTIKVIKKESDNKDSKGVSKGKNKIKYILKKFKFKNIKKEAKLIVIVLLILILGVYVYSNYHRFGLVINKNINDKDVINVPISNIDNQIIDYNNEILLYNNKSISTYNKKGKKTWSKNLESNFIPYINTTGKYIQIINKDNGNIYVYSSKYESARIKINGIIKSAKITDGGVSIVEYSTKGSKTTIDIYTKSGKLKYTVKLNTNTVSDYVLSKDNRYLAYTDVNIEGISLSTKLNVLDLTTTKNKEIVTKDNELSYNLYTVGSSFYTLFDEGAVKYSKLTKKTKEYQIPDINMLNIDIKDNKYIMIAHNKDLKEYSLSIQNFGSKKSKDKEIEEAPRHFICKDKLIYLTYLKSVSIYNEWGNNIKNYTSDNILTKPVIFNNGKSLAMLISNKIIIFTI